MRAFAAIELPRPIRQAVSELSRRLARTGADVKWVELENLHVTLRFFGEISEAQRRELEHHLSATATAIPCFRLQVGTIGAFPSVMAARVIWVGLAQGCEQMQRLAAELDRVLAQAGWLREDRPFSAHVTIGRVRSPKGRSRLAEQLRAAEWTPPEPFDVDHMTLFRSELTSAGAIYTPLASFPFNPEAFTPSA